ncbi:uncharacterized protein VTP21DRAFT_6152 [Calcarisporiella thermophila]|uniref:uncharacterized protein n=1 Tax=Calcarisporiella thermophila TaxID=911321 RepID=UPI00374451A5
MVKLTILAFLASAVMMVSATPVDQLDQLDHKIPALAKRACSYPCIPKSCEVYGCNSGNCRKWCNMCGCP